MAAHTNKKGMVRKNIWFTSYQIEMLEEERDLSGDSLSMLIRHAVRKWLEAKESSRRLLRGKES